jgi:hypothetical protein
MMSKPKLLRDLPYDPEIHLRCNDRELFVAKNLPGMPEEVAAAITGWLHDHGLSEHECATGHPIERDPHRRTVTWTGSRRDVDGRRAPVNTRHVDHAPPEIPLDQEWPAPFPQILLDQPDSPAVCGSCGRYLPKDRR